MKLWNKLAPLTLPRVKRLDDWREKKCRDRLKESPELSYWLDLFKIIAGSKFLQGLGPARKDGQKPWRATFDWLITNQHNATKILEGHYDA